jgi:hypothetical protein
MRPDAEGIVYAPVSFRVDPDRVRAFGDVLGITAGIAPTFPTVAEFTVLPGVIDDPRLDLDFTRVVHGAQAYVYVRPLREGETLWVGATIASAKVRAGAGFLTVVMDLRDEAGSLVATATSSLIERPPT